MYEFTGASSRHHYTSETLHPKCTNLHFRPKPHSHNSSVVCLFCIYPRLFYFKYFPKRPKKGKKKQQKQKTNHVKGLREEKQK